MKGTWTPVDPAGKEETIDVGDFFQAAKSVAGKEAKQAVDSAMSQAQTLGHKLSAKSNQDQSDGLALFDIEFRRSCERRWIAGKHVPWVGLDVPVGSSTRNMSRSRMVDTAGVQTGLVFLLIM